MAAIRTQREIRQRAPWWLIVLLVLNFGLMTYDARDNATKERKIRSIAQTIADPFERIASGVGNYVGGFFSNFTDLRRASTENQQLREQVRQMQSELREAAPKAAEAERLEKLLGLSANAGFKTVARHAPHRPIMRHDLKKVGRGTHKW